MKNQKGFTLIELVVVIVILGILSAVAIPKFIDMRTEAADAQANGVYGAAQAAAALNHASKLVGHAATARPSYDGDACVDGLVINGTCLMNALDGTPDGWTASGATITAAINGSTYTITVAPVETATTKAGLTKTKTTP